MAWVIEMVNRIVWGAPALAGILGTGLYLSVRTGFAQLRLFPRALKLFLSRLSRKQETAGVPPFQALCTALAATVGTGNLVGVAGAIALGGPGSIFWMWVCAVLGMMTKFAEAALAVRYRVKEKGEYLGGPMYIISRGLGRRWNWLAVLYCFFGVVAAFGVGNATQVNAVITGLNQVIVYFGGAQTRKQDLLMGCVMALLVAAMLLGGAKRIGKTAEFLVPFVSCGYLLLGAGVLIARAEAVPAAFGAIVRGAFSPRAVTGGALGSMFQALRVGVSRGVFTNEAGMGTASIAHAAADVAHPAEQGLMGIMEVFLDTIVICTMTALVILLSGVSVPYGQAAGAELTISGFTAVYGSWVSIFTAVAMCCFAFSTILGWGLYGARCAEFLFGSKIILPFNVAYALVAIVGATVNLGLVWDVSDTFNGFMIVPNLIAVFALAPNVFKMIKEYFQEK